MTEQWRVTLLSAVVPGWGQWELGHRRAGLWFLGATMALVASLIVCAILDRGVVLVAVALLELSAWASVHAWLVAARHSPPAPRAR